MGIETQVAVTSFEEPYRGPRRLGGSIAFVGAVWLAARLLVQGIGLLVVALAGTAPHSRPGPFGSFFNWDSGYFACIVAHGYFGPACPGGTDTARLAFFPGYPLAVSGVARVLSAGAVPADNVIVASMWAVSALASFAAAVLLYHLVTQQHGVRIARYCVTFLLIGPYSLFLVASYSEATYLMCAVGAWYFCRRRKYVLCAIMGAGASATRVNGCFLAVALVVMYLCRSRAVDGRQLFRWRDLGVVCLSASGGVAFFVWQWARTGHPLAWMTAQSAAWNRHTQWPWLTLYHQAIHMAFETRRDWQVQAIMEFLFAILLCAALALLVRERSWPEVTLVGLTAVTMMTSTTYLSLARNTLTLFPLAVLVAVLLDRHRRSQRFLVPGVFGLGLALLCYNSVQFALGNWAD